MNKAARLVIVLMIASCEKITACEIPDVISPKVEISIFLRFKEPSYRQNWVYNALEPQLKWQEYTAGPFSQTLEGDGYRVSFCVPVTYNLPDKFSLTLGMQEHQLLPRPVEWEDDRTRGKMKPISLSSLSNPDWIILKSAIWSSDATSNGIFDLEIYNPTAADRMGGTLSLWIRDVRPRCSSAGSDANEVLVSVKDSRCKIADKSGGNSATCTPQISSADPGTSRSLMRKMSVWKGACGDIDAELQLGPTGTFHPGLNKLRYVFQHVGAMDDLLGASNKTRGPSSFSHEIVVNDASIRPNRRRVEE